MFCIHLLPNICFCGEFLSLGDQKIIIIIIKCQLAIPTKGFFEKKKVPMLPDFDEFFFEIMTFRQ